MSAELHIIRWNVCVDIWKRDLLFGILETKTLFVSLPLFLLERLPPLIFSGQVCVLIVLAP